MASENVKIKSTVLSEFAEVELGDKRLSRRLEKLVPVIEAQPDVSFPNAFEDTGELEAFYRFVENPKVNFGKLCAGHVRETVARAAAHDVVLAVHDTTEFDFSGGSKRKGLGRLRQSGHGFLGHFSLAVAAGGSREVLGVLSVQPWARTKESPTARRQANEISYAESRKLPSEQERWSRSVGRVEGLLADETSVIHLMDSEADDYTGIARMVDKERRFVIRLGYDRAVNPSAVGDAKRIKTAIANAPIVCSRTVNLSRRRRLPAGGKRRTCERDERVATLSISAGKVVVRRPTSVEKEQPKSLALNVVHVFEFDAPADVEPVEWHLLTTEPIDTEEDILKVVDYYRCRWLIEEYFKALKTGCAYEKRQLESYQTLLNGLALFIPVAWNILRLRTLSRSQPELPAEQVLTASQIELLECRYPKLISEQPTVQEALLAVARLGGHLRRNGQPGWLVLIRGYKRLLVLEEGLELGRQLAAMHPSDRH